MRVKTICETVITNKFWHIYMNPVWLESRNGIWRACFVCCVCCIIFFFFVSSVPFIIIFVVIAFFGILCTWLVHNVIQIVWYLGTSMNWWRERDSENRIYLLLVSIYLYVLCINICFLALVSLYSPNFVYFVCARWCVASERNVNHGNYLNRQKS